MTGPLTVLVADDAPSIRVLCRINLELDGHQVLEADSLERARELLRASEVDVLLLDLHVGLEDGLDLLQEVRRSYPRVRVALLTGTADPRTLQGRADAMIAKPFDPSELRRVVESLGGRV